MVIFQQVPFDKQYNVNISHRCKCIKQTAVSLNVTHRSPKSNYDQPERAIYEGFAPGMMPI